MAEVGEEKKQILVIDDEPDVIVYLTQLLEDNGYAVSSAADAEEGTGKVAAARPDLITLDISMPEKSGVRFYREMRSDEELKKIPIVIVTGVSSTQDGGTGTDFKRFLSTRKELSPPDGFIMKPIDQGEFLDTVAKLLKA
jgi:CheY-like chemotaxis protein